MIDFARYRAAAEYDLAEGQSVSILHPRTLLELLAIAEASESLRADAMRLDWMEADMHALSWGDDGDRLCIVGTTGYVGRGETWREAIDTAIGASS